MKRTANFLLSQEFENEHTSEMILHVLFYFTASKNEEYQLTAYKCLKDYIFINE